MVRWTVGDEVDELAAEQAVAREPGDALGGAVDEQDAAGVVEDDDAVGAGLEVLLERVDAAQPALGLVARAGDPVRLVAQALEHGAVAEVRGGDRRDQLAERDAGVAAQAGQPDGALAQEDRAERAAAPLHGEHGDRADVARHEVIAERLRERVRADVVDEDRGERADRLAGPRGTRRSRA